MQSIGERLEEARKRKGVTIREAAEATKIRGDYLNSFEANNFAINVPDIYVRGFLRSYSNFLKVNSDKVITDYHATLIGEAKAAKRDHREFFGRMELQQPLIGETPAEEEEAPSRDERKEDSGESIFEKLNVDREIAIKIGIIAVIAILSIISLIWIFSKITGDPEPASSTPPANTSTNLVPTTTTPTTTTVESQVIRLIAIGDVRVSVTERESGAVLLSLHPMSNGQSVEITKRGPVKIDYTAGENLLVEVDGKRFQTGKTGENYSWIK